MRTLGALFLIGIGCGLIAVAWQGLRNGELPAGSNFLRPYRPSREREPLAFSFYLVVYVCGGAALLVWGVAIMTGHAPALKLR